MINILLFITVSIIAYMGYYIGNRNYLSPTFIAALMMTISSFVVMINTDYWGYVISWKTYLLISISLLSFLLGQLVGQSIKRTFIIGSSNNLIADNRIKNPSKLMLWLLMIYSVVVVVLYFRQQISNASLFSMQGTLSGIVQANRYNSISDLSNSGVIRLAVLLVESITYVMALSYLYNSVLLNKKYIGTWKLIVIIVCYFLCGILSTGRIFIISLGGTLVVLFLFFNYLKRNWVAYTINSKLRRRIIIIGILVLFAFRSLGYLSGKSETKSFYDNFSQYLGGSIVCLDFFVTGKGAGISELNGPQLFRGIYNILNMLGFDIQIHPYNLPMQHWANTGANIYTSLFDYYYNFGALGLFTIQFLEGILYGYIWKKVKSGSCSWAYIVIYAGVFCYYLFFYSIAEKLIRETFTITIIVKVVATIILVRLIQEKKHEATEY